MEPQATSDLASFRFRAGVVSEDRTVPRICLADSQKVVMDYLE